MKTVQQFKVALTFGSLSETPEDDIQMKTIDPSFHGVRFTIF